jgi:acetolactate synthase-1/2/3 large subunit
MPCALGAALACPDRQVINIEADGSAMYTLQALWTQARENTNVITLICSNRKYATIEYEYLQAGHRQPGLSTMSLIQLENPKIDWIDISRGMNVPAVSVSTSQELVSELELALRASGPHLIEVILNA